MTASGFPPTRPGIITSLSRNPLTNDSGVAMLFLASSKAANKSGSLPSLGRGSIAFQSPKSLWPYPYSRPGQGFILQ